MGRDWDKLAGEEGEEVPSRRFNRMFKLGAMGARVGASTLASKLGSLLPGDREVRDEDLKRAYARNARHMAEVLGRLKGASMKIGQLMSSDPELLPPEFSDVLTSLQSDAPPMTYRAVKKQIETALDRPIETVFREFDPEPIGSASIGQVHRAVLESGEVVAVKVQYPGVVESLASDLKSLKSMMIYGRPFIDGERLDQYFDEIRRVLEQETNYVAEAENLARFTEILADREGLCCPRPFKEWTRESVLVMEYMEGTKLDQALAAMEEGPRKKDLLMRWVQTYSWMFHEVHELHADPHPGNFLLTEDDTLVMLDFGCVRKFDEAFTDGLLDVLDACWQMQPERAIAIYRDLGFGTGDGELDPGLVDEYHEIILAPFLRDEEFDFTDWTPAFDGKKFMLRHPSFGFKLVPPADALPYLRVLSGIKGLLAKMNARGNLHRMAVETARRRGRLTDEPLRF